MIRALSSLLAIMMAVPTSSQTTQVSQFVSPCPNVFTYDPTGVESNKWNGVVTLTTDTTLYALWLNIVLDNKANILGNWVGEVTTDDNLDFKIENTKMTIKPGSLTIPFFVQYKVGDKVPKLVAIRFNGKEICQVETPQVVERIEPVKAIDYEDVRPAVTTTTTVRPRVTTTSRNYNKQQTTKAQYWQQTEKPQTTTNSLYWTQTTPAPTTTTLPSQYWPETRTTESTSRTTQYWHQTTPTLKPIYWTQATTEVKPQTTVKNPAWPYVKDQQNQQIPTNQTSVLKIQGWSSAQSQIKDTRNRTQNSQTQVQNKQQSTSENRYKVQNETKHQTSVNPPNWPNVAVAKVNQTVSSTGSRPNNLPIEVIQVGEKKYWSKIPAENITGSPVKVPSRSESISDGWSGNRQRVPDTGLQTQPYAQISITQAQSLPPQNYNQATDAPLYVRPEDRQIISSTYNVDNIPQTYSGVGSQNRQPVDPYQKTIPQRPQNTGNIRPVQLAGEDNAQKQTIWAGEEYKTWVEPASNGMATRHHVNGRIMTLDASGLAFDQATAEPPAPAPNRIENEQYDAAKQEEYYDGGLPVLYIPNHGPQTTVEPKCGKVLLNKVRGVNLESTETEEGQWPWQIALYQQQTSVDFRYICGGTLVSTRHVITAAHCVTRKKSTRLVNKNTLTVYLGKHNLRNSVEGVQVKFVNRILLYPEYDASTFRTDLAILELRDTVTYSERIQPACLWPEQETDLRNVVGQTGSIPGWGYETTGVARTELTLLHMTVVDQETCISSYPEFFRVYTSDRTYCAGYRNHGAACNGDSGGGMFFQKGDSWYLRGVVSLSVARQGSFSCDPNHYVIFTDAAKFLPWIQGNIEDYI